MKRGLVILCSALVTVQLASIDSCSVYMENTRPTPTDLVQFAPGTSRDDVLAKLGAPITSTPKPEGTSCDLYRLYTKGYGETGKIPITVLETAADFFTLGLAEIVLTPTEAMTKNDQHPVDFCYKDEKLVSVAQRPESGTPAGAETTAVTAAAASTGNPASSTTAAPTSAATSSPASSANPQSAAIPASASSPPQAASAVATTTTTTSTAVSPPPGGIQAPDVGGQH